VARAGAILTDTLYAMNGRYERVSRGGVVSERQYIVANGEAVAVRNRAGSAAPTVTYLLHDHLGSTDAYVSSTGALLARASYQPMGTRRSGDGSAATPTTAEWQQIDAATARGYTGHEHLDNLGVIHMNGRVFDPVLGRFLSPDPFVQSPYDGQSLNRYSYVRNNPLRYTDPSGYCFNDHPAADHLAESCLEQIIVNASRGMGNLGDIWGASIQAGSLAQAAAAAAAVPAGDIAAANKGIEEFVVTGSRIDNRGFVALDASMYALLPQSLESVVRLIGGFFSPESLAIAAMTAAVVEPTPVGEGVVLVVTASSSKALVPYYPINNGFLGNPSRIALNAGQVIDRFGGSRFSRFFSPEGTPAAARSLPPGTELQALRRFEVKQPLTVEVGPVAPAFGQLGFGVQYRTSSTLQELVEKGVIQEIGP
jgi:RHS repeat-associated protein